MHSAAFPVPPGDARFRLTLFGRFHLEACGHAVRLPTRKVESLLAYLALHPQPHPREHLAALLWGDRPHAQATASLRTALSALRKTLGAAALITDRRSVQLNTRLDLWVDVRAFQANWLPETAPAQGRPEAELYAGDLLPDFYDEWLVPLREQLRRKHLERLLGLAQDLRARSDYSQAIQVAQQVLAADAVNETAHQHLIFCYLAAGDRAEALAQYERCRAVLQRELGVDPLPETTALYHWLRQAEAPAPVTPAAGAALPSNVPFPISSFVGRAAELARLRQALQPGHTVEGTPARLTTLTGPGGCGKTRLANQGALAMLAERVYADGVWWVALAPLADGALVPQAVAQALGVRKPASRGVVQALVEHLRLRHLLLVLDNCEHLPDASARLAETLLSACPRVQIMATSRQALGLTGEVALPVPPLSLPPPGNTATLSPAALLAAEGPRLFCERARAVRADFAATEANAAGIAAICSALDGIPLAIELAAVQTRSFSIEQIAARLRQDSPLSLANSSPVAPPRHRTLRATLAWSYGLLPEREQALFRALAVFAGGWTLEAAEHLDGDAEASPGQGRGATVAQRLARLVDKSLVVADFASSRVRYRYLDTIRAYAYDRLQAHAEADGARLRHLAYYAGLAEITAAAQFGPQEFEALQQTDAEVDNLRAALRTGQELPSAAETALGLAVNLLRYWTVRGSSREGRDWLAVLLALAGSAPAGLRARALNALGYLAWRQHEVADARTAYTTALDVADTLGAEGALERAHALRGLGLLAYAERRLGEARGLFAAALALFRQQGDETGIGFALTGLGEVARTEGRYDEAADYYAENLALRRAQGSVLNASVGLHNSGQVALARGQVDQAMELLVEGLMLNHRFGYPQGMAIALAGVAAVAAAKGALAQSARWSAAAWAWLNALGEVLEPADQLVFDRYLDQARAQLPPEAFGQAWAEGLAAAEGGAEQIVQEVLKAHGAAPR
jgi:predicted ATPase/DNA-binding SARP family transcriptional activator